MPRFELGTSSLPRRHTAGLCHIGTSAPLMLEVFGLKDYGNGPGNICFREGNRANTYKPAHCSAGQPREISSRTLMLSTTPSRVSTSITGMIFSLATAFITGTKSMVPVPIGMWVSSFPSLSWR
jgi:hypothetical protein